jgi:GH35 family endo-1,4-beta-xylanase
VTEREIPHFEVDPNPMLGVCDHLEPGTAEVILRNHLRLTRSVGANWIRLDMSWEDIEPKQDVWRFDFWDILVRVSSHYGIRILPVISRTPRWASSRPDSNLYYAYPPRDLKDFGDFIQKVVERYGRKIYYWEIWNEPDAQFWRGSVGGFYRLLKEARSTLRETDPTARIVLGGISFEGISFLEELFLLNAVDVIDVVGIHLYGRGPNDVSKKLEEFLGVINRSGTAKPVWVTEIGKPTLPQYRSEDHQADFLKKTLLDLSSNPQVEKIFWYELKDSGLVPFWREHNFGLVKFDLTPKVSYEAYLSIAGSVTVNGGLKTRKT